MDFAFTEEQQSLRATLRRLLDDTCPLATAVELAGHPEGVAWDAWRAIVELGIMGLGIPEHLGGVEATAVELLIVQEELGRAVAPVPFFSSIVMAASLVVDSGDVDAQAAYLPAIASGTLLATAAVADVATGIGSITPPVRATETSGGWRLDGATHYVLDGPTAGLVLLAAATGDGASIFAVERASPGVSIDTVPSLDPSRRLATVTFGGAPARLVGTEGDGWRLVDRLVDRTLIAMSAEQVGGADRTLEMAVGYAKERVQFGKPIGSFQAIKHRCADMLLDVETARSAAHFAARLAVDGSDSEVAVAATLAKGVCSSAYTRCAEQNIQIHGGIGFTWEHPAHLFLKRAKATELLFGTVSFHRRQLAERIGL